MGDSIKEVKTRITKERQAFAALNNLWRSNEKQPEDQMQNIKE
jgi:hypothetical protein